MLTFWLLGYKRSPRLQDKWPVGVGELYKQRNFASVLERHVSVLLGRVALVLVA